MEDAAGLQNTTGVFRAEMSFSLHASRLPKPATQFMLAMPTLFGAPPTFGEDFIARGFREPVATVVVYNALRRFRQETSAALNAVFVNVGAGTGYFTALAATFDFATISVEAHEPLRATLHLTALANGWLGANRSLIVHACADNATGVDRMLFVSPTRWLAARIRSQNDDDLRIEMPRTHLHPVKSVALNDVIPAHARVAMLLVDVENFELEVLQGASAALNACRVQHVLLSNVKISGDIFAKLRTVLALVNRCNYRAYKYQERTNARTLCKRVIDLPRADTRCV
jgi:FkbM family methyltransferase